MAKGFRDEIRALAAQLAAERAQTGRLEAAAAAAEAAEKRSAWLMAGLFLLALAATDALPSGRLAAPLLLAAFRGL